MTCMCHNSSMGKKGGKGAREYSSKAIGRSIDSRGERYSGAFDAYGYYDR